MTLKGFAGKYRLKVKKDGCGDDQVAGRLGHLYDHGANRMGMVLEDSPDGSLGRTLLKRRKRALEGGFYLHQEGDYEAILLFDPTNTQQAKLALRLVGTKKKRKVDPTQADRLRRWRESRQDSSRPSVEGPATF